MISNDWHTQGMFWTGMSSFYRTYKQTSRFHVCDWTNETGLRHGAVTTNIILPTGKSVSFVPKFWYKLHVYKQLFTIKYKNSHSLSGNTYMNENLNQADISNSYEKLQFY